MPDGSINLFISYAHVDSAFVDRLEADLRQQGFETWMDRQRLIGGQIWHQELQESVERAQVLLVMLSPHAVASQYVRNEYSYALALGKVVIPIYYRECNIPMDLRLIQWVDFRQSYEQGLAALLQTLSSQQAHLNSSTPSTPSESLNTSTPAVPSSQQEHEVALLSTPGGQNIECPWNIPFGRNPFFTGRGSLLEHLHEQLSRSHRAALNQAVALSGLGGIGKTQTAIEYAYRYRPEYTAVFWVRADTRETLVADYVAIARLLSLPEQDAPDQSQIVVAVKRWLERQEGWLLILDNADDLSLLTDFLPASGQGYLLLTTRAQATGKIATSLPVEKMDHSEGIQLLLRRAKLLDHEEPLDNVSATERKSAQELFTELDGLPLALDQAGAYIEDTSCSLSDYLQLYRRYHLALLQQQSSMMTEYPRTVASTWEISFEQVKQTSPAAAELLRLCAFLHPDAIPEAMLTEGSVDLGPELSPVVTNPLLLNGAIKVLLRYSLVKRNTEAKSLNLHRLVQVVLRESLDDQSQRQWAERSLRVVNRAFPDVELTTWDRCELCISHVLVCARWTQQYAFTFPEASRLLYMAGLYLHKRGGYAQAEQLLKWAHSIREQTLGPEHYETASALNALADLFVYQGNYEQALQLLQPALIRFESVLGAEHPEVVETLHILAGVYNYEGKYAQAEPLYQRVLTIDEKTLGPEHPYLAADLNNLATLYVKQGRYDQAEPFYQRSLALCEHALGSEHPDTLTALANLANLYTTQGKYVQAEPLLQQALAGFERVQGSEYVDTAWVFQLQGRLYLKQGKYAQAEPLLHRASALLERLLGPENSYAILNQLYLAHLFQATARYEQSEALYQQTQTLFERALGPEHPRVAETLTGLAQLYTSQGRYEQAHSLYQQALAIQEHALGTDHPDTATTRTACANLFQMYSLQNSIQNPR